MGNTFNFRKGTKITKPPVWGDHRAITFAQSLVEPNELLYVCRAGSNLFGTATEKSDTDFRGIFLPSKESCFLNNASDNLSYSSGDEEKNTSDDVDFSFWSVQKWFGLMERGDSNALSVLFSSINPDMVVYCNPKFNDVLMNPRYLYNPSNVDSFVGFSKSQSIKYGLKGTRLNSSIKLIEYLKQFDGETRMFDVWSDLPVDENMKHVPNDGGSLKLMMFDFCGKQIQSTTKIKYTLDMVQKFCDTHGQRTRNAADSGGIDWKSLSHSLRTLLEANEMLQNGYITYPLVSAKMLLSVKNGESTLEEFDSVYTGLEYTVNESKKSNNNENYMNVTSKHKMILNLYQEGNNDET